jgi:putative spermidine/putrescine transport system ATP-binding protein
MGVRKEYSGGVVAIDDVSLELAQGRFLVLLGPSGSGKTTLLRVISGLESFSSGTIEIGGRDVSRVPAHQRNIGFVFQNHGLFPHLSVHDNVAFGLRLRKLRRAEIDQRVDEALEMVRLSGFAKRATTQLSGGQQQRVALARALAIRPALLLLDEPLASLDKNLRLKMQDEIRSLQRTLGIAAVMVTHDQEEAMAMGDQLVLLASGRIEQHGTPRELYARPASVFAARFIGAANVFDVVDSVADSVTVDGGHVLPLPHASHDAPTHVVIRPESVRIRPGGEGALQGRVLDVNDIGSRSRVLVELEGIARPFVVEASATEVRGLERGARIGLHLEPGDVLPIVERERP